MKKKLLSSIVLGAFLATTPMTAFAGTMIVDLGNPVSVMDGKEIWMENVAGISQDGVILVPVRDVAEAYDGTVTYDKETNTVNLRFPNGNWATIEINAAASVDGYRGTSGDGIVSVGTFIDDRLYIPATLMATCLGARIELIDYGQEQVYRVIYHVR